MPNLPTHFSFALETLAALDDSSIQANLGSFLLGSTTPDIRARTKWKRSHTHFASLSVERVGVGAEGLFRSNPDLTEAARKSPATRAFLAGYLSHLVTDETWITQIYRPYFGNRDMFPDPMKANVYDRAVQLDMDRNARLEAPGMDKIIERLHASDRYVRVGFIDGETLSSWQAWVAHFCARPFSWERLHFMAQRMYRGSPQVEEEVEDFLTDPAANISRVYQQVPQKRISEFRGFAVTEAAREIKERLDVS